MRFDEIQAEIGSEDDEVRRQAVISIGESPDARLREALVCGLGDTSWRVREEAVRVASELTDRFELLPRLVDAVCQGGNVGLRNAAIAVLGLLGEDAAGALIEALGRVEPTAVKFVIEALGAVGGAAATAALVAQLDSDDPNNVAASLEALASAGGPGAEQALRMRLSSTDAFVRMAALDALGRMDVVLPWEVLSSLVPDTFLRGVLIPALGRCRDARAVDYLVEALRRLPARPSSPACEALQQLGQECPEALPRLQAALGTLDPPMVDGLVGIAEEGEAPANQGATLVLCLAQEPAVVRGLLGVVGGAEVGDELRFALQDWGEVLVDLLFEYAARRDAPRGGDALALAAELAELHWPLEDMGGRPARARVRAELRAALGSADQELRVSAARTFATWGEGADAAGLVAAAASGGELLVAACRRGLLAMSGRAPDAVREALVGVALDSEVGIAFTDLIVELEGHAALPRLREVLLGGTPDARCAAVVGLSVLGGAPAAELIALSLTDESWEVQLSAAEALGRVVDTEGEALGVEALLLALDGSPPELQAALARALGIAGNPRAVASLRALVERAGPRVRVAALEALSELSAPGLDELLLQALDHQDSELVKHALSRVSLDQPACLEAALSLLDHSRWDVRQLAVRLLGHRREPQVRDAIAARAEVEQDELVLRALDRAMGLGSDRPAGGP